MMVYDLRFEPRVRKAHLVLTNQGRATVVLSYRDGQAFEAVVATGKETVWRWSADKMFTLMLWTYTLDPGKSLRYTIDLPALEPGTYQLKAFVTADNLSLEPARLEFRISS